MTADGFRQWLDLNNIPGDAELIVAIPITSFDVAGYTTIVPRLEKDGTVLIGDGNII